MTDMEIMKILEEIANDCFYRRNCDGCRFNNRGECILKKTPADWDLEEINSKNT